MVILPFTNSIFVEAYMLQVLLLHSQQHPILSRPREVPHQHAPMVLMTIKASNCRLHKVFWSHRSLLQPKKGTKLLLYFYIWHILHIFWLTQSLLFKFTLGSSVSRTPSLLAHPLLFFTQLSLSSLDTTDKKLSKETIKCKKKFWIN